MTGELQSSLQVSFTLLYEQAAVWVMSKLQQDLLHVPVLPRRIRYTCDLLLQGARKSHQLNKLALGTLIHLPKKKKHKCTAHKHLLFKNL